LDIDLHRGTKRIYQGSEIDPPPFIY